MTISWTHYSVVLDAGVQGVDADAQGPSRPCQRGGWIPESKTPNGVAEVPLTEIAVRAFRSQLEISGTGPWLFPSDRNPLGYPADLQERLENDSAALVFSTSDYTIFVRPTLPG